MDRYRSAVLGADQRPVPNASIEVRLTRVANPLPTLYNADSTDNNPTTTISNPFTTDALGNYAFAAPDGDYDILISGAGLQSKILRHVKLFDNTVTYPSPMLGTVTSVTVSAPADLFSVGAAVTSSGSIALSKATVAANKFLAGPTTGADAAWTFRVIVAADLPLSGVTPATYGSGALVPVLAVDAYGRVTAAAEAAVTPGWAAITGKPTTLAGYGITNGVECIFVATATTTISNTTTATTLFAAGAGSLTIGANRLAAGSVVRAEFTGFISDDSATTKAVTVYLGGALVGTVTIASGGAAQPTPVAFRLVVEVTIQAAGATGTALVSYKMSISNSGTYTAYNPASENAYNGAGTGTLNTTASNPFNVQWAWGLAGAAKSITVQSATVEILR